HRRLHSEYIAPSAVAVPTSVSVHTGIGVAGPVVAGSIVRLPAACQPSITPGTIETTRPSRQIASSASSLSTSGANAGRTRVSHTTVATSTATGPTDA